MTTNDAIEYLVRLYPRSKTPPATISLIRDELAKLTDEQRTRAVEACKTKSKYFPSIAELLAWAQGREPGKARAKKDEARWDSGTLAFMRREQEAARRGDVIEQRFLRALRHAWHAGRWRSKNGTLHPSDVATFGTVERFDSYMNGLGLNPDGSAINGRGLHELAVPLEMGRRETSPL